MQSKLRARALQLRNETYALYLAARDPRTPWLARAVVLFILAYAISPIDLIPDFIPILGYLDDLIMIPAGIALALKLIPVEVMQDARLRAQIELADSRLSFIGGAVIVLIWILAIIICADIILHLLRKPA